MTFVLSPRNVMLPWKISRLSVILNKNCPSKKRYSMVCWMSEAIPEFYNHEVLTVIAEAITLEEASIGWSDVSATKWSFVRKVLNSSHVSLGRLSVNLDVKSQFTKSYFHNSTCWLSLHICREEVEYIFLQTKSSLMDSFSLGADLNLP